MLFRSASDAPASVLVKRWIQLGQVVQSAERAGLPPDEALLRRIAAATQGLAEMPDRALVPPAEWTEHPVPARGWFLPFAILLLLVEVALRGKTML